MSPGGKMYSLSVMSIGIVFRETSFDRGGRLTLVSRSLLYFSLKTPDSYVRISALYFRLTAEAPNVAIFSRSSF